MFGEILQVVLSIAGVKNVTEVVKAYESLVVNLKDCSEAGYVALMGALTDSVFGDARAECVIEDLLKTMKLVHKDYLDEGYQE